MKQPKFKVGDRVHRSERWARGWPSLRVHLNEVGTVEAVYHTSDGWYINVLWDCIEDRVPLVGAGWSPQELELAPSQVLANGAT